MKNYFLFKIKILEDLAIPQKLILEINKIVLKNEEGEVYVLREKEFRTEFYEQLNSIYCDLYIQDENISYLLDEDYEISDFNVRIYSYDNSHYKYEIIEEYGDISIDLDNQIKAELLNLSKKEECMTITGHRPDRLYGYNLKDNQYQKLVTKIMNECERAIIERNISIFITGSNLGTDTVAFFGVEKIKEKYPNILNIVVIPFEQINEKWNIDNIDRYERMLKQADMVINTELLDDYSFKYAKKGDFDPKKLQMKNKFITDIAKNYLFVYDGIDSGNTFNVMNYAKYMHDDYNITTIEP